MEKDYSSVCTTRIVGLAAEECGLLSYDLDQSFDKNDLLDHEFPLVIGDSIYEQPMIKPEDILVDICGKRIEEIVEVIGDMEKSWLTRKNQVGKEYQPSSEKLWEFVKDHAENHVECMYGEEFKEEFTRLGDDLFIKIKM